MKLFFTVLFTVISLLGITQFNDSTQLRTIDSARTAQEGDMYLDTIRQDFRIGLTHGKLGKLTDNQKLSLDSANKIIRLESGDSVDLNKTITGPRFYVGKFQISASGNVTVVGLPFQPTSILFTAYANIETDSINNDNGVGNNSNTVANSFNFMRGFARDDNGTSDLWRRKRNFY